MAASSGGDIPTQLAALLGREVVQIRKSTDSPPRISIIDVTRAITGHNADYSAQAVRNVCDQYLEVSEKIADLKFKGREIRARTPARRRWAKCPGEIDFV